MVLDKLAFLVKVEFLSLVVASLNPAVVVQVAVSHRTQLKVASDGAVVRPAVAVVAVAGDRVRTTAPERASTLLPLTSSPVRVQGVPRSVMLMARRKVVEHEATNDQGGVEEEVRVVVRVPAVHPPLQQQPQQGDHANHPCADQAHS